MIRDGGERRRDDARRKPVDLRRDDKLVASRRHDLAFLILTAADVQMSNQSFPKKNG